MPGYSIIESDDHSILSQKKTRNTQNIWWFRIFFIAMSFLHKIFQFLLQTLASKKNPAFDSAQGQSQFFCNFSIFKSGGMHGKRNFIFFGERMYNLIHLFKVIRTFGTIES